MDKVIGWFCVGIVLFALVAGFHALYVLNTINFQGVIQ